MRLMEDAPQAVRGAMVLAVALLATAAVSPGAAAAESKGLDCLHAQRLAGVLYDARENGTTEETARRLLAEGGNGAYGFVASRVFRAPADLSRRLVLHTAWQQCEDMNKAARK